MTEPVVALTDYALACEAGLLAALVLRDRRRFGSLRRWFALCFTSMAVASACGGTVHGFFHEEESTGNGALWTATLIAMGVTALAMWSIGARLILSTRSARWMSVAAVVQWAAYVMTIIVHTDNFIWAMLDNVPPLFFLLAALCIEFARCRNSAALIAAVGPALTLLSAILQALHFGLHKVHFDHNALYHVLQGIALLAFYLGARRMLERHCAQIDSKEMTG